MSSGNELSYALPQPAVVKWFKVYCAGLSILYLCASPLSLIYFLVPADELEMPEALATIMGCVILVMCLVFSVAVGLPVLLGRKPWVWVYGLVVIVLGLTSPCLMPACIPLLLFWIKPATKLYFGRQ